ncbi:MAG: exonuclease domain-containing protein [Janthinobacterium lividum]
MRYIIVDLEATCWQERSDRTQMEIIEIGAVTLHSSAGPTGAEFSRFVRPIAAPKLSVFCTELTSIRQEDVERADYFWTVFPEFLEWIGEEPFVLCSWGAYDLNQFRQDCQRHGMTFPDAFERHINLKKEFAQWKNIRPCGMSKALELIKLPLVGQYHRAIDDARNIAKLAQLVLPKVEADEEVEADRVAEKL